MVQDRERPGESVKACGKEAPGRPHQRGVGGDEDGPAGLKPSLRLAMAEPPDGGQGVKVMPPGVLVLVADLCLQLVFQRQLVDTEVLLVPRGGAEVDPKRAEVS